MTNDPSNRVDAPKIGEAPLLEPTALGFRCRYMFDEAGLTVQVQERRILYSESGKPLGSGWFMHSNVIVFFPSALKAAEALVRNHVSQYDVELVATLQPVWEAWRSVPEGPAPPPQGAPTGVMN